MARMGWHYTPCDRGGGGDGRGAAVLLVAAALIIAAIAKPAVHAAEAVGRVAVEALEITGIVLASAAVLAAAAWGTRCAVRWHARNRQAIPRHTPAVLPGSEALRAAQQAVLDARRPAVEAPKPLYVLRPHQPRVTHAPRQQQPRAKDPT